jgi:hypothetical protein
MAIFLLTPEQIEDARTKLARIWRCKSIASDYADIDAVSDRNIKIGYWLSQQPEYKEELCSNKNGTSYAGWTQPSRDRLLDVVAIGYWGGGPAVDVAPRTKPTRDEVNRVPYSSFKTNDEYIQDARKIVARTRRAWPFCDKHQLAHELNSELEGEEMVCYLRCEKC